MKASLYNEKFACPFSRWLHYTDTRFSNFAIEYLHENEKVRETVFACSSGPRSKLLCQKNDGRKLLIHNEFPLSHFVTFLLLYVTNITPNYLYLTKCLPYSYIMFKLRKMVYAWREIFSCRRNLLASIPCGLYGINVNVHFALSPVW